MRQSARIYGPDPPRAFASLPKFADFCVIPVEIGDRSGLAARARSRLASHKEIALRWVRRGRHSSSYIAQVPANERPPLAHLAHSRQMQHSVPRQGVERMRGGHPRIDANGPKRTWDLPRQRKPESKFAYWLLTDPRECGILAVST